MTDEGKLDTLISTLRERIKRGDFGTSGRLPSISQFTKEYSLARDTVYSALQTLRDEGLLRVSNSAYVVSKPLLLIGGTPNFKVYLEKQGLIPDFKDVIVPEVIEMSDDISNLFGITSGMKVVHRIKCQGTKEVPLRIEENWYPFHLAESFIGAMTGNPDLDIAREIRLSTGLEITKVKENLIARHPTKDEMKILDISRTSPVFDARRTFQTSNDITVLYNRTILVAAYFTMYTERSTSWQQAINPKV